MESPFAFYPQKNWCLTRKTFCFAGCPVCHSRTLSVIIKQWAEAQILRILLEWLFHCDHLHRIELDSRQIFLLCVHSDTQNTGRWGRPSSGNIAMQICIITQQSEIQKVHFLVLYRFCYRLIVLTLSSNSSLLIYCNSQCCAGRFTCWGPAAAPQPLSAGWSCQCGALCPLWPLTCNHKDGNEGHVYIPHSHRW